MGHGTGMVCGVGKEVRSWKLKLAGVAMLRGRGLERGGVFGRGLIGSMLPWPCLQPWEGS